MRFPGWMAEYEISDETADLLEPAAFRRFYDRVLPVVYGYMLRRCGGREDVAMELTQETFVSAVRSLRSGTRVESPLAWLMSIARRRLVDHYRRQGVRRRVRPPADPAEIDGWRPTGMEAAVLAALDRVPNRYRLVLVLRYVDDLPVAEVAGHLELSVAATESLLARARSAFAEAYGGHDDG